MRFPDKFKNADNKPKLADSDKKISSVVGKPSLPRFAPQEKKTN